MATIDLNDLLKAINEIKQEKEIKHRGDSVKAEAESSYDCDENIAASQNIKEEKQDEALGENFVLEAEFLEESSLSQEPSSLALPSEGKEKAALSHQAHAKVIKLYPEMEVDEESALKEQSSSHKVEEKKTQSQKNLDPKWLDDLIKSADHLSRKAKALRAAPLLLTEVYEQGLTDELKKDIQEKLSSWLTLAEASDVLAYIKEITAEESFHKYYATV